ncbi:MAG: hypothetical protein ACOX0W_08510 [Sphaerochaetaceae bacterium]|jgi:hypothetical protein
MKKTILITLLACVLLGGVFADSLDDASFDISTNIQTVAEIKVFDSDADISVMNWSGLTALPSFEFTGGNRYKAFYVQH